MFIHLKLKNNNHTRYYVDFVKLSDDNSVFGFIWGNRWDLRSYTWEMKNFSCPMELGEKLERYFSSLIYDDKVRNIQYPLLKIYLSPYARGILCDDLQMEQSPLFSMMGLDKCSSYIY